MKCHEIFSQDHGLEQVLESTQLQEFCFLELSYGTLLSFEIHF